MNVADNPMNEQPHRTATPAAPDDAPRAALDAEEIYELEDHEFMLEADEPTLEMPPPAADDITLEMPAATPRVPPLPAVFKPQLPRWAAASRALLDGWREPVAEDAQRTIEIQLFAAPERPLDAESAELSAREQLASIAQQVSARDVYLLEVERALAAANGRARGHAFRIAELEAQLQVALLQPPPETSPTGQTKAKPSAPTKRGVHAKTKAAAKPTAKAKANAKPKATTKLKTNAELQRIEGIGAMLAQRLAALGVKTVETLADWTADDVTVAAKRLGVSRERIQREGWVRQARALRRRKRPSSSR
jgi:predicted flap endonuclease-1-like 5' DNA nuclease